MTNVVSVKGRGVVSSALVGISLVLAGSLSGSTAWARGAALGPIMGGVEVADSDVVAQTTVVVYDQSGGLCTGSLIGSDLVLTAAHCVEGGAASLSIIFTRNLKNASAGVSRKVLGAETPAGWAGVEHAEGEDQSDIALIRFKGELAPGYRAADLLPVNHVFVKGETALLAGYGITAAASEDPFGITAGTLRKAEVKIADNLRKTDVVVDQTGGKGACHGDSGGPAFAIQNGRALLWGVTNRSYPDDSPDDCAHYGVYTNLNAYRAWLAEAAAKLRAL